MRGKWRLGADSVSIYDNGCARPCTTGNAGLPWEPRTLTWTCAVDLDMTFLPKSALSAALQLVDKANSGRTETEILATFVGRLKAKEHYDIFTTTYGRFPTGFGLFYAYAAQLEVESIRDVSVSPATSGVGPLKPLTVCEVLGSLDQYSGMPLAVVAVQYSSWEFVALQEGGCESRLVTGTHRWPNAITDRWMHPFAPNPPADFQLDPITLAEKSARVKAHTTLGVRTERGREYRDKLVVIYGRLETRERFLEVQVADGVVGNGFGHLGFAPAQLLVVGDAAIRVLEVAEATAESGTR